MIRTYDNFTSAWVDHIRQVVERPDFEASPRGMKIKEVLGAQFKITRPRHRIPYISPARKYSLQYMMAELLWYMVGDNSTEWITTYAPFWKGISDDGLTANSAYGARIFRPHDRIAPPSRPDWVQWDYLVDELASDNDSRRAVLHVRSPHDSLLAHKDVPCTLTLQFFIREGMLHQVASMRSTDIILGLAYDVPAFTLFQEALALKLSDVLKRPIGLGSYIHVSNSLHLYERHFDMARQIVKDHAAGRVPMGPEMPPMPWPFVERLSWVYAVEAQLRLVDDIKMLGDVIAEADMKAEDPYWRDWFRILASHRAGKLGAHQARSELLRTSEFPGYRLFSKIDP